MATRFYAKKGTKFNAPHPEKVKDAEGETGEFDAYKNRRRHGLDRRSNLERRSNKEVHDFWQGKEYFVLQPGYAFTSKKPKTAYTGQFGEPYYEDRREY